MQIAEQTSKNQLLTRLERLLLQAISQNGLDSQAALNACVTLTNKLIEEGTTQQNAGNLEQAEIFYQKAKDITAPLQSSQTNGIQQEFILSRGNCILKLSQIMEKEQNYQKAFLLLKESMPMFEKLEDQKRRKQDQDVYLLYAKVLFHATENCYMMKKRQDAVEYGLRCIEVMRTLRIDGETIVELTQEEENQNNLRDLLEQKKKEYLMLSRVNYIVGKQQFKFELDRAALTHLMHATILSHLLLGNDNPVTIKYQHKFQAVSQKLEFQKALDGDIQNFKKFEKEVSSGQIQQYEQTKQKTNFRIKNIQIKNQQEEIQAQFKKIKPIRIESANSSRNKLTTQNKPYFTRKLSPPKQTYHSLMTQITSRMSKYHMPEYISKVRQDYEEKLNSNQDNQHLMKILEQEKDMKPNNLVKGAFIIQSPRSAISKSSLPYTNNTSTKNAGCKFSLIDKVLTTDYLSGDLLFSYRSSNVMRSQRSSPFRPQTARAGAIDYINLGDLTQLQDEVTMKDVNLNKLMLQRPQFHSTHEPEKTKKQNNITNPEVNKKKKVITPEKSFKNEKRRNIVQKKNKPPTISTSQQQAPEKIQRPSSAKKSLRLGSLEYIKHSSEAHLPDINEENSIIFKVLAGSLLKPDHLVADGQNNSSKFDNDNDADANSRIEQTQIKSQSSINEIVQKQPEKWIDLYLQDYQMEELEDAALKITIFFHTLKNNNVVSGNRRRMLAKRPSQQTMSKRNKSGNSQNNSKVSKTSSLIDELHPRIPSNKSARHSHLVRTSAQRTLTNPMLESVTIKSSVKAKPSQIGFGQLLKDMKSTENDQSNNRNKRIIQFANDINSHQASRITFYDKFFFDTQTTVWTIENPQFNFFCPLSIQKIQSQPNEKDMITSQNFSDQVLPNDYLNRVLSNNLATKALCLIVSVQISNNYFKARLRFIIQNISNNLDDLEEQVHNDTNLLLESLLTLYLKQRFVHHKQQSYQSERQFQNLIFLSNTQSLENKSKYSKTCQSFVDKVFYLLKNHVKYVKKVSGDCLINTLDERRERQENFYHTNDQWYYSLENFQFNFKVHVDKKQQLKKQMIQLEDIKQPQFQEKLKFVFEVSPYQKQMSDSQLTFNVQLNFPDQVDDSPPGPPDIIESNIIENKNSLMINNSYTENGSAISINQKEENQNQNIENEQSKGQIVLTDSQTNSNQQKIEKKISARLSILKNVRSQNQKSETFIFQDSPNFKLSQLNKSVQPNYDFSSVAGSAQNASLQKLEVKSGGSSPRKNFMTIKKIDSIMEEPDIKAFGKSNPNRKSDKLITTENQYYFDLSEQDFLRENFPQFELATKTQVLIQINFQVEAYEINEVIHLQRDYSKIYNGIYFNQMTQSIRTDIPDLQYSLPNKQFTIINRFLFHNQIVKHQKEYYLMAIQISRQDPLQDYENIGVIIYLQQMCLQNVWFDQQQITFAQLLQLIYDNKIPPQKNPKRVIQRQNIKNSLLFKGRIPVNDQLNLVNKLPQIFDIQNCHLIIDTVDHTKPSKLQFNQQIDQLVQIINNKNLYLQTYLCRNQLQDVLFILMNNLIRMKPSSSVFIQQEVQLASQTFLPIMKLIKDQCQIKIGLKDNEIYTNLNNQNNMVRVTIKTSAALVISEEDINHHQENLNDRNLIVGSDIQTFQNYNSLFYLNNNKYFLQLSETKNAHTMIKNVKVEFFNKSKRSSEFALDYLNDQMSKLELITLRTQLYNLIKTGQAFARLVFELYKQTVYDPNKKQYFYKDLNKFDSLEKVSHMLQCNSSMFKDDVIRSKLFKYVINLTISSHFKNKFIGKILDFDTTSQRDPQRQERRIQEKLNELDTFLLMYIQDSDRLTANLETQVKVLQQTILFHFHKQQLKLTIISSNMLEDVEEQKFFMRTYFLSKRFYQYSKVKNMGKVLIQTQVFRFNKLYLHKKGNDSGQVFFYFLISPQDSKTKLFKLILDLSDVQNLIWNSVTADNCFDNIILYDTVQRVMAALVCYGTNTYRGLKLPLSQLSQNREKHKYDLVNSFGETTTGGDLFKNLKNKKPSQPSRVNSPQISSPRISVLLPLMVKIPSSKLIQNDDSDEDFFEQGSTKQLAEQNHSQLIDKMVLELNAFPREVINVLSNHTMLTPVYRGLKTIYKQVRKLSNKYLIITVSQYPRLQFYQLHFYIPQTCRSYICFMYPSDFWVMDPVFLDGIFPSQLSQSTDLIEQLFESQWKFQEISKVYDIIKQDPYALDTLQQQQMTAQNSRANTIVQIVEEEKNKSEIQISDSKISIVDDSIKFQEKYDFQKIKTTNSSKYRKTISYVKMPYEILDDEAQPKEESFSKPSEVVQTKNPEIGSRLIDQLQRSRRSSSQPPVDLFMKEKLKQVSHQVIQNKLLISQRKSLQVPHKKSKWQQFSQEDNKASSPAPSDDGSSQNSVTDQQHLEEEQDIPDEAQVDPETNVYAKNKQLFYEVFLNRKNNMEVINNFEIKIWEQLLNNINIVKNDQGKYVVEIDTYKGVIRETLLNTIIHLGQEENVNFEIYVENFFKPTNDLFEPFYSLRLRDTALYSLYIRISFLERMRTHNDKIMLRQILFSYFNEESFNLQNRDLRHSQDVMMYEFNLADVHRLAVFVMNKIRKNYIKQSASSSLTNQYTSVRTQFSEYSLKFNTVDEFYEDKKCPQVMKINIDKSIEAIMNGKLYQYVLLHRGLFTLRPQQMIAIFYRASKERFYLFIWNTQNAKNTVQILTMLKVETQIPHVKDMLKLKLYLEIGKRILLSFKNNLMMQTFFILNELPKSTNTNKKFTFAD